MSAPTIPADTTRLTREEINRKQKEFIFPSVTTYFSDPVPMDHAQMQHVWDVDGKKYLDFFGGIVTISVGHCNPRVISRTKAQIDRLQHVSTCFPNEPMVPARREAGADHARRAQEVLLHQQRHRSQRDRHPIRAHAHRQLTRWSPCATDTAAAPHSPAGSPA